MNGIYINKGTTINANWGASIVVSTDGNLWTHIPIKDLTLNPVVTSKNTASPIANQQKKAMMYVTKHGERILEFDIQDVRNQAGWSGAATATAAAILASTDMGDWLC